MGKSKMSACIAAYILCSSFCQKAIIFKKIIEHFSHRETETWNLVITTQREILNLLSDHFVSWMIIMVWCPSLTTFPLCIFVVWAIDTHVCPHPRNTLVNFIDGRVPVRNITNYMILIVNWIVLFPNKWSRFIFPAWYSPIHRVRLSECTCKLKAECNKNAL